MLSPEELKRYNRHLILPEFGMSKQELLKASKVLVIGAGGLGCPILLYLATAGLGHLTIVDADTIDISNLQRQVLYNHEDIGKLKAETAAARLRAVNPYINVQAICENIHRDNALDLISAHDIVIDGSDNFATRYLVNDACVIANKPLVYGSIFKFEGQVSVFNFKGGPTYRCIYPEPPNAHEVPSCSEIGVLGILPGFIGLLQATEAVKLITGIGEPLSGKLLLYDMLSNQQTTISFSRNPDIHIHELLEDYDSFCGTKSYDSLPEELSPQEALAFINQQNVQIIDVREEWEYQICNIAGATLIPLRSLPDKIELLDMTKPILLYCHHGIRSRQALDYLKDKGYDKAMHIKGGIDSWASDVDEVMEKY